MENLQFTSTNCTLNDSTCNCFWDKFKDPSNCFNCKICQQAYLFTCYNTNAKLAKSVLTSNSNFWLVCNHCKQSKDIEASLSQFNQLIPSFGLVNEKIDKLSKDIKEINSTITHLEELLRKLPGNEMSNSVNKLLYTNTTSHYGMNCNLPSSTNAVGNSSVTGNYHNNSSYFPNTRNQVDYLRLCIDGINECAPNSNYSQRTKADSGEINNILKFLGINTTICNVHQIGKYTQGHN